MGGEFSDERMDRYLCQFCVVFLPHCNADELLLRQGEDFGYMNYCLGGMRYLEELTWVSVCS